MTELALCCITSLSCGSGCCFPRSLHKKTGKLGCFQLSAVHTLVLYELNTTDRTAASAPAPAWP